MRELVLTSVRSVNLLHAALSDAGVLTRWSGVLTLQSIIVANEQGSFTTPSFVSFTEKERLIGESAKNQAAMNPKNTVFDIKSVLPFRVW